MNFREIAETRRAINFFDPEKDVSDKLLGEVIDIASKTPSSFNLQASFFPGGDSSAQGLDVTVAILSGFLRQTGGTGILGSGAVKNDLLVLADITQLCLKISKGECSIKMIILEFVLAWVGADK